MKFSSFAVAAALSLASLASQATTTVTPASGTQTLSFNDLVYGTPNGGLLAVGAFTDTFDFALTSTANLGTSFSETKVKFGSLAILNIDFTGGGFSIVDHANPGNVLWAGTPNSSGVFQDSDAASLASLVITVPKFDVIVKGTANGLSGGTYGFTMFATSVPEPESYALALSGLVLAGVFMNRRCNNG
jgi:PEP-CTERM motif